MKETNVFELDERLSRYCKPHQIEAYRMRTFGEKLSVEDISQAQNLSVSSVKKSIDRVETLLQQRNEWWFGLTLRAVNALRDNTDIDSKDRLKEVLETGRLVLVGMSVRYDGKIIPNIGKQSLSDFFEHVGLKMSENR